MLRRMLTAALAVALMGGSAGGYQASWQAESRAALEDVQLVHHREGPCSAIHWRLRPRPERADEIRAAVRRIIRCAVRRWSVPGGAPKAVCIGGREGGWWPWANQFTSNPNKGVYQHNIRYWPERAETYLQDEWEIGHSVYNARGNIIVSIRMAHDPNIGWGPWSVADQC